MVHNRKPQECLSEDLLRDLTIRIVEGKKIILNQIKKAPDKIPDSVYQSGEENIKEHIDNCNLCRKFLVHEIFSLIRYISGTKNEYAMKHIKQILKNTSYLQGGRLQRDIIEIPLFHTKIDGIKPELATAAATTPDIFQPYLFISKNQRLYLHQAPHPKTGKLSYYLGGEEAPNEETEIIINSKLYKTDSNRYIEFGTEDPIFSEDTTVIVRIKRPKDTE